MDLKKYKASVQLAEMRFESDPSEDNKQLLDNAREAYELAANPEKKTEGSGPETPAELNQDIAPVDPAKLEASQQASALPTPAEQSQDIAPADPAKLEASQQVPAPQTPAATGTAPAFPATVEEKKKPAVPGKAAAEKK